MMLTRRIFFRYSSTSVTKSSIAGVPLRLYRWLDIYEDFVGLKEVKQAQASVNDAEKTFIDSQTERRTFSDRLMKIQSELNNIRSEMEKFPRSDDRYLKLFQVEHNLIKEENMCQHQLQRHENQERQLFASFQLALRQSQEKEKMRVEKTKYWSLIGSIVGTLLGIIGATLSNRYRMQEFHHLHEKSRKLVEDQISHHESRIRQINDEIHNSLSSQTAPIVVSTFDEEAQQRFQTQIISKTGLIVVSTSFVSLLIAFWFHQK